MRRLGTARQYDKYANREEDFTQAGQPTVRFGISVTELPANGEPALAPPLLL
jgi:hypothetical protein